jgi:NADH-quinone oxidoreductase subunit N
MLNFLVFFNIILITSSFFKQKATNLYTITIQIHPIILDLNVLGFIICLLILLSKIVIINQHINYINNTLYVNNYTQFIKIILIISGLTILLNTRKFLKYEKEVTLEYPLLLQLGVLFLMITISTYSLISFFLALFGVSLILYVLLAINKNTHSSREAAIKYFLLSAISSGLFCYSIFFFLLFYKTTFFYVINLIGTIFLIKYWDNYIYNYGLLANGYAFVFFIIACFFKLGAYPSHLWTVEIYQGSSNPVMSFFLLPVKLVVFSVVSKILINIFNSLQWFWSILIWLASVFSLVWGCCGALIEQDFKKFLAFSSINQMGFLLIGISCIYFEAFRSSIIYLTIYMLTNIALFNIFITITQNLTNTRLIYIQELNLFSKNNFCLSVIIAITMCSMAGIPPLAGFFGKFFLFLHAFEFNFFSIIFFGMITTLVSTIYYLNIINNMWFLKNYRYDFYRSEITPLNYFFLISSTFVLIFSFMLLEPIIFLFQLICK